MKVVNLRDIELQRAEEFLSNNLPFSVNMMGCIQRFPDRTDSYFMVNRDLITAALTVFRSGYNRHIWNDPIAWVVGNAEDSKQLVSIIELHGTVLMSTVDMSGFVAAKYPGARGFPEKIMIREGKPEDPTFKFQSQNLSEEFAADSLSLATGVTGKSINTELINREKRFLEERKCFGIVQESRVVSRGAIMSSVKEYSSVGAFFTDEKYRGQGFASDVIGTVLAEASKVSENTCLFVNGKNERAISVYSKLGFHTSGKAYFVETGTGVVP